VNLQTTVRLIVDAILINDFVKAAEHAGDLAEWVEREGIKPRVSLEDFEIICRIFPRGLGDKLIVEKA
jgi:hypothetical protein